MGKRQVTPRTYWKADVTTHIHIHNYWQCRITSEPNMHIFGLLEGAGAQRTSRTSVRKIECFIIWWSWICKVLVYMCGGEEVREREHNLNSERQMECDRCWVRYIMCLWHGICAQVFLYEDQSTILHSAGSLLHPYRLQWANAAKCFSQQQQSFVWEQGHKFFVGAPRTSITQEAQRCSKYT